MRMKRTRVCVFHLNSHVARTKPGITGEAFAVMFADCLHYQVDFIGGDANMAAYRYAGGRFPCPLRRVPTRGCSGTS